MIVRWTGTINPGTSSDLALAFWDILPAVADLIKRKSIAMAFLLPLLNGQGVQQTHQVLYWEFHEMKGQQPSGKANGS